MPRVCTVCSLPDRGRDRVEDEWLAGAPKTRIAAKYGVGEQAVRYHLKHHLPELLALARDAERAGRADTLLDRIEALQNSTLDILEATQSTHDHRTALAAIREARSNLELIGEVTKKLGRGATLNLELNPEWLQIEAVIVNTLEEYPAARQAVVDALTELPDGPN